MTMPVKFFNQINEAHIRVKLDNNNESLSKKFARRNCKNPILNYYRRKEVTENLITIESRNKTSTKIDISSFITKLKEEIRQKNKGYDFNRSPVNINTKQDFHP